MASTRTVETYKCPHCGSTAEVVFFDYSQPYGDGNGYQVVCVCDYDLDAQELSPTIAEAKREFAKLVVND